MSSKIRMVRPNVGLEPSVQREYWTFELFAKLICYILLCGSVEVYELIWRDKGYKAILHEQYLCFRPIRENWYWEVLIIFVQRRFVIMMLNLVLTRLGQKL